LAWSFAKGGRKGDLIAGRLGIGLCPPYVAEVDIELIDMKEGWSPYLSLDDAKKATSPEVLSDLIARKKF